MNTPAFARVFFALFILAAGALAQELAFGFNPSFDAPGSRAIVFADAMERARSLDPAGTRLFSDCELPAGTWTVEWSGDGSAELVGQVSEISRAPGRAEYSIQANARPLSVRWSGQVENLRVWLPGVRGRAFWPPFLAIMRHLKPVTLRTLDWSLPNVPPAGRDGRLVSPRLQVLLVNRIGCGLHYCVPVGLSEPELVELFAALANVSGELTLEVGNENWNPGLWSWNWLDAQPDRVVDATAREIERVFAIADRELGAKARHYVGGHLANPWFLRTVLALLPPNVHVDAAGAAAYVGPRDVPNTAEECAQACRARIVEIRTKVREHRAIAQARGASFELYEAGQSFPFGGGAVAEAQRTAAMGEAYRELAAMLESSGAVRVNWYSFMTSQDVASVAPFGVFESMSAQPMPKGSAVIELMRAR